MPFYDEVADRDINIDEHRGTSQRAKLQNNAEIENELAAMHITNSWDDISRSFEDERGWSEDPV